MPIVEIKTIPKPEINLLQTLPSKVATALFASLGWPETRFVVTVETLDSKQVQANGRKNEQLDAGFALVRISVAKGKSQEESDIIVRTVAGAVANGLQIPEELVIVCYQQQETGGLFAMGHYL